MARHKPIYEPGELDSIRKHLGDISQDEAQKMASLLGGEVGTEKAPYDVEASYRRLESAQNKVIPGKSRTVSEDSTHIHVKKGSSSGSRSAVTGKIARLSYFDRIRLDFFMAQPEFSIKNQIQAFSSFFDFSGKKPDILNPWFVKNSIPAISGQAEALRDAFKILFPANRPKRKKELSQNVLALMVIEEILHWNIEDLKEEQNRLTRYPKNASIQSCEPFIRLLFTPILKMIDLDIDKHLIPALEIALACALTDSDQEEHPPLYAAINTAQRSVEALFREGRYVWYPLFLRLITGKWYPFSEFMILQRNRILAFFEIKETSVINGAMVKRVMELKTLEAEERKKTVQEEISVQKETKPEIPKKVQKGLEILDVLFPRAGWLMLDEHPDLYAYYKNILSLVSGTDAIPVDDPLLPVYILTVILEELFFGFDSIEFKKDQPALRERASVFTADISRWHLFCDDFLQKRYLTKLQDICRMAETNPESRFSPYVKRQESDMLWLKRYYLFPGLLFEIMVPNKPQKEKEIPVMYETVPEIISFLQAIAYDIDTGMRQQKENPEIPVIFTKIANPLAPFKFTVQNPLSWRLKLLYSDGKSSIRANNSNLIFCTLSILSVLEWLLTLEYEYGGKGIAYLPYRNINGKPNYGNAAAIDPDDLFRKEIERRKTMKEVSG